MYVGLSQNKLQCVFMVMKKHVAQCNSVDKEKKKIYQALIHTQVPAALIQSNLHIMRKQVQAQQFDL